MPTIRLATHDDMRAITSQHLELIDELPHLYIPAGAVDIPLPPYALEMGAADLMRCWGVAKGEGDGSVAHYALQFPGSLVAARNFGQFVDRGELVYHGAEPAADFA